MANEAPFELQLLNAEVENGNISVAVKKFLDVQLKYYLKELTFEALDRCYHENSKMLKVEHYTLRSSHIPVQREESDKSYVFSATTSIQKIGKIFKSEDLNDQSDPKELKLENGTVSDIVIPRDFKQRSANDSSLELLVSSPREKFDWKMTERLCLKENNNNWWSVAVIANSLQSHLSSLDHPNNLVDLFDLIKGPLFQHFIDHRVLARVMPKLLKDERFELGVTGFLRQILPCRTLLQLKESRCTIFPIYHNEMMSSLNLRSFRKSLNKCKNSQQHGRSKRAVEVIDVKDVFEIEFEEQYAKRQKLLEETTENSKQKLKECSNSFLNFHVDKRTLKKNCESILNPVFHYL
ncbi:uncharacterized protein LOC142337133 [Convolutriloba macropyga]|uniref:uncharacterized protein LOC142337133 n=1 Tax=Convolutriloba macropyga TaxID=536237 RepID=UPI003F528033